MTLGHMVKGAKCWNKKHRVKSEQLFCFFIDFAFSFCREKETSGIVFLKKLHGLLCDECTHNLRNCAFNNREKDNMKLIL